MPEFFHDFLHEIGATDPFHLEAAESRLRCRIGDTKDWDVVRDVHEGQRLGRSEAEVPSGRPFQRLFEIRHPHGASLHPERGRDEPSNKVPPKTRGFEVQHGSAPIRFRSRYVDSRGRADPISREVPEVVFPLERAERGVERRDIVARGQEIAFEKMESGVPGADVHKAVKEFFDGAGYKTGRRNGRMQGFFHGTGHGLGLEVHETPRLSANSNDFLRSGQVVTVEPGLYYPEIGGVRLEDVAHITGNSPRNLTKFEKVLEV